MRTTAIHLLAAAGVLATCACRGGSGAAPAGGAPAGDSAARSPEEAERRTALVRVVDAIPEGRPLDVFAGDQVAFSGMQYKAVTAYQEVPRGSVTFALRPAGQDRADPLAQQTQGLTGGDHYTLVAMPSREAKPAALEVLRDDLGGLASGKARVRLVNATPDAGAVTVFVGARTEPLVSGVDAIDASGYEDVEPVAGTLEVRRQSDRQVLARLPQTRFDAGAFYTVFLLGRSAGGLEAMLVEDQHAPGL